MRMRPILLVVLYMAVAAEPLTLAFVQGHPHLNAFTARQIQDFTFNVMISMLAVTGRPGKAGPHERWLQ
jgi:hypothetical protein